MRFVFFFTFFLFNFLEAKPLCLDVRAKSAVLMNAETGTILFEKNSASQAYPASCTKIATVLYALEIKHPDLSSLVEVSNESIRVKPVGRNWSKLPSYWLEVDGTKLGLKKGEKISLEALLHGILLPSGNDAANVFAESMSGSISNFVDELNRYLKSIGCQNTHFSNPHGLHHPDHFTSAYDLCLIAQRAMQIQTFREIVTKVTYTKPHTNLQPEERLRQHNHLLWPGRYYYSKAIGIKTGYTSQALNNLVAAAEQDGRMLIAVVLGCEKSADRYIDAKKMFEAAFHEQKVHQVFFKSNENFSRKIDGATNTLNAALSQEVAIDYFPSEEPDHPKAQITWKIASLPIHPKDSVGELRLMDSKGKVLQSAPIFAKEEVGASWSYHVNQWWNRLVHIF